MLGSMEAAEKVIFDIIILVGLAETVWWMYVHFETLPSN